MCGLALWPSSSQTYTTGSILTGQLGLSVTGNHPLASRLSGQRNVLER
jgi:hypothetical protein